MPLPLLRDDRVCLEPTLLFQAAFQFIGARTAYDMGQPPALRGKRNPPDPNGDQPTACTVHESPLRAIFRLQFRHAGHRPASTSGNAASTCPTTCSTC